MDVHSLKVVGIVALTAVVLSLTYPASKSTHIVTSVFIGGWLKPRGLRLLAVCRLPRVEEGNV